MTTAKTKLTEAESRLDRGCFTAEDVQTLARFVGVSPDKVRRVTEAAVVVAALPNRRNP